MHHTRRIQFIASIVGIFVIGGVLFVFWYAGRDAGRQASVFDGWTLVDGTAPEEQEGDRILNDQEGRATENGSSVSEFTENYRSEKYGFSFRYPDGFTISELDEDGGELIVVSRPESEQSFQIFIVPWDRGAITARRILEDVPGLVIESPQEVILSDGNPGLIFWSGDASVGKTREVWFARAGHLYQVTTFAEFDSWLAGIMSTWKFNR